MSQTATATVPTVDNGVNTEALFATINVVREQPELAKFQFRAANRWVRGTHSTTRINGYFGAGQEHGRDDDFQADGDHPAVLCGEDKGATPVEYLLHAIATCLTAGIANIASARKVQLHSVEAKVEGDINMLGILGLSDEVRNGYQGIKVSFEITGDADEETLRGLVAQSRARSAVYDVLTNGTPVEITAEVRSA